MSLYPRFAAMIAAWNAGDIDGALATMTDDVVWHVAAGAFAPLEGKAAVRGFLEGLRADMAATDWRIVHHAEAGDRLFVEGVDAYTRTNGVAVAMPYAAIVEFDGGLIAAWRDYIDTRRMEKLREGGPVPAHVTALADR
ncbi:nuclear transport factor 2 family protein [Sphingomonas sp.]|uniref:nuclear transport factor 2 family protein n=1 Tax=Sphingomonas sp. TaxID=28214 RepID=UPI002CF80E03|nr:nuclear transport factor 2 family protein [Sphingomonas sp.]HWK34855.1 nuclear transport factor 2 family protein [Sphingomonas sp.]